MAFVNGEASGGIGIGGASPGAHMSFSPATAIGLAIGGAANLVIPVAILRARALDSRTIRIDFSAPVISNLALADVGNYEFTTVAASAVKPFVESITVPSIASPRYVLVNVSEMTDGAAYGMRMNVESDDPALGWNEIRIDTTEFAFNGVGVPPAIALVLGTNATTAEIRFDETLLDTATLRQVATYGFDLGLAVEKVLAVLGNVVLLKTSEQAPGVLYTLTILQPVTDLANNELATSSSQMLGYTEPEAVEPKLRQKVYNFLIEGIRLADATDEGNLFLERFLAGPQEFWAGIIDQIMEVPNLWDAEKIRDDLVPFLKNIVGWTPDLDAITEPLDTPTLRRLILASVPFWKERGTEDAMEFILRLVVGTELRILNWFQFRALYDEVVFGEDWGGNDSWIIPEEDSDRFQVRIVNDGAMNKDVVRSLIRLCRPAGERVDILYLLGLDLCNTLDQWTSKYGSETLGDGTIQLVDPGPQDEIHMSDPAARLWSSYRVDYYARVFEKARLMFYWSGNDDYYFVDVDFVDAPGSVVFRLYKRTAGVETLIGSSATLVDVLNEEWYTYSVEVIRHPSGDTVARVLLDNEPLGVEAQDNDHLQGSVGFGHGSGAGIELGAIEIYPIPGESETIDLGGVLVTS